VLVVAMILTVALRRTKLRRRNERLKQKFGPEYDIVVEQHGASQGLGILEARARRVEHLPLRSLTPAECGNFAQAWQRAQVQFIDSPNHGVNSAHDLVQRVMRARGYPVEAFEQDVADLSVDYGDIVQHYRAAHALHQANRAARVNTEELRQALVHYRTMFEELLGVELEQPPPVSRRQIEPENRQQRASGDR
jgi:hypothetical protein